LDLALDRVGRAVVVGKTISFDFPVSSNAFDKTFNDVTPPLSGDGFVTYLSPQGDALFYSTYLGGDGEDAVEGVTIDSGGSAVVTGSTWASNFPIRGLAYDSSHNGAYDAFLARIEPGQGTNALRLSTFYGGSTSDFGHSIAIAPDSSLFVAGYTASSDFPTTPGAFDSTFHGFEDLFVLHFGPGGETPPRSRGIRPPPASSRRPARRRSLSNDRSFARGCRRSFTQRTQRSKARKETNSRGNPGPVF